MYAERTPPEEPPCDVQNAWTLAHDKRPCRYPLDPGNAEVVSVWRLVRRQVVTAGPQGQPIDLDLGAVIRVMDLLGVVDKATVLERVRWLWHETDGARKD